MSVYACIIDAIKSVPSYFINPVSIYINKIKVYP